MSSVQEHLTEARAHLLSAAGELEKYIQTQDGDVATPVVAAHFGLDFAALQGVNHLLFCLAVDTAVDHMDMVKTAVLKAKHYRLPSESPVAREKRRASRG